MEFRCRQITAILRFLVMGLAVAAGAAEKVSSEDLVTKHLSAIGSVEARTAKTLRSGSGTVSLDLMSGASGHMDGTATVASMDKKFNFVMYFDAPEYVGEQFKFDGQNTFVANNTTDRKFNLANFMWAHSVILKQGLWGGVWNTGWPLLDLKTNNAELKPEGTQKVNGKEQLKFIYRGKHIESELRIHLYFDPDTFRHTMTRYEFYGPVGNIPAIQVTEEFGDFHEEKGVTLPHAWTIRYEPEPTAQVGGYTMLWKVQLPKVAVQTDAEAAAAGAAKKN